MTQTSPILTLRPSVYGKFLSLGEKKWYLRGVTYGPFQKGREVKMMERDLAAMAAGGVNALRTYTIPPRPFLDCALRHGLRVLVGIPWEQHVAFLSDGGVASSVEKRIRNGVRACATHPAVFGYAVGNEIPTDIVRWYGRRRIERFLERLYNVAKSEDPDALVTYVNYPPTEYLELPFVDLFCFNIYLESPKRFDAYLARLQNLAGDKPLLLTETGLDSHRHGEDAQAQALTWQIRAGFAAGCAGLFVFSWTDEWHRGGCEIEDWSFGLTRRDRSEKPAAAAVRRAWTRIPFEPRQDWPRVSVVVCTYNGTATLGECLDGLRQVEYPDFEVIVVNDGSSEAVSAMARQYPVRLINLPHGGLSAARNAGLRAASGSIVAYLDDDARPEPHWLHYLAHTFCTSDFAAVGGPNIPPPSDSRIAKCVANAPGGPVHVLVSDREAEHIPGCNMAFRRAVLEEIGGFDVRFMVAGDDVDVCWRLQEAGYKIGFSPGAMVWHHRRRCIRSYWKQQVGYGRAEALLERKWPQRFNGAGHAAWAGRIYGGKRPTLLSWRRSRVYHGTWGSALFQSIYEPAPTQLGAIAHMPEWYLIIAALAVMTALGVLWKPLLMFSPLLGLTLATSAVHMALSAKGASVPGVALRALVGWLNLLQPLARLYGRMGSGLTPWRRLRVRGFAVPGWRSLTIWSEHWRSGSDWLEGMEKELQSIEAMVFRGGAYDRWDLEVRGGALGSVRMRAAIEEHGAGRQLVRVRLWPHWAWFGPVITLVSTTLAFAAARDHALAATGIFGATALCTLVATLEEWCTATATWLRVLKKTKATAKLAAPTAQARDKKCNGALHDSSMGSLVQKHEVAHLCPHGTQP